MRWVKLLSSIALLAGPLVFGTTANAYDPYLVVPPARVVEASPSHRYAQMTEQQALAELERRGILFQRVHEKIGRVRTPIRLTGRLHGVYIHSSLPEEQRTETVFEICDARFALVLDDFAALLQKHDIVEVVHYTMYRPAMGAAARASVDESPSGEAKRRVAWFSEAGWVEGPARDWAEGEVFAKKHRGSNKRTTGHSEQKGEKKAASKGRRAGENEKASHAVSGNRAPRGGSKGATVGKRRGEKGAARRPRRSRTRGSAVRHRRGKVRHSSIKHGVKPHRSRHPDGLAIDVGALRKRDGTWLRVSHDFHGTIGAPTCGPRAKPPKDPKGKELWNIVCEAFDRKIFTYVLTPNFNLAHQDHFHMEIKPGMRWFLYH